MATLAFGLVGAAIGSTGVFSGIAGMIGMTSMGFGWTMGQMIGGLFGGGGGQKTHTEGARLSDLKVTNSAYGVGIPVVYGTMRLAGNIIDSTDKIEHSQTQTQSSGGKGMGGGGSESSYTSYTYSISCLVGICEGPITGVKRIWMNNQLVFDGSGATVESIQASKLKANSVTIYLGTEDQEPDPTFEAIRGVGNCPAYRGIAYISIKDMQLADFGNSLPNIEVEVVKAGAVQGMHRVSYGSFDIPSVYKKGFPYTGYRKCIPILEDIDVGTCQISKYWAYSELTWPLNPYNSVMLPLGGDNALSAQSPFINPVDLVNLEVAVGGGNSHVVGSSSWPEFRTHHATWQKEDPINANGQQFYGGSRGNTTEWCFISTFPTSDILYAGLDLWIKSTDGPNGTIRALGTKTLKYGVNKPMVVSSLTGTSFTIKQDIEQILVDNGATGQYLMGVTVESHKQYFILWTADNFYGTAKHFYKFACVGMDFELIEQGDVDLNGMAFIPNRYDTYAGGYSADTAGGVFISHNISLHTTATFIGSSYNSYFISSAEGDTVWVVGHSGGNGSSYSNIAMAINKFRFENGTLKYKASMYDLDSYPGINPSNPIYNYSFSIYASCLAKGGVLCVVVPKRVDTSPTLINATPSSTQGYETQVYKYWGALNYAYYTDFPIVTNQTVPLSSVVADLCDRSGLSATEYDVSQLTDQVDGMVIARPTSARSIINDLQAAYFFDGLETDGKVKFVKRGQTPVLEIPQDDLAAYDASTNTDQVPDIVQVTRIQEMELPREVAVTYMSKDASYQEGTQYDRRQNSPSVNIVSTQLPMSLSDAHAKSIASVGLFSAWQERVQFKFSTSKKYSYIDPTDVVYLTKDNVKFAARILKRTDNADGTITWEAVREDSEVYTQNSAAGATNAGSQSISYPAPLITIPISCPPLTDNDADNYTYYVGVTSALESGGSGVVFETKDNGATYTKIADTSKQVGFGSLTSALPAPSNFYLPDEANELKIRIQPWIVLESVSFQDLLDKKNAILVGDEIIQYREATSLGNGEWRLRGLLRGVAATESSSTHSSGDRVVLLDYYALKRVRFESADIGVARNVTAISSGGSLSSSRKISFTPTNITKLPFQVTNINSMRNTNNGDWYINWMRRPRKNSEWQNLTEVPLVETSESYKIRVYSNSSYTTLLNTFTVSTNSYQYTLSQQIADLGGANTNGISTLYITITQIGDNGESAVVKHTNTQEYLVIVNDVYKGVSLLNFNGNTTDEYGLTWTVNGTATTSTTKFKFGTHSLYLGASGAYLSTPTNPNFNTGSNNLTVEYWFNNTATAQYTTHVVKKQNAFNTGEWAILQNTTVGSGNIQIWVADYNAGSPFITSSINGLNDGNWHHLAFVRNGSTWTLYIDGNAVGSNTFAGSITATSQNFNIGYDPNNTARQYIGYIDDFHFINGTAKYTNAFTPPTAQLPKYVSGLHFDGIGSGTVSSLLHFDGTNGSTTFTDVTGKTWTPTNATISTTQSKFGGASGYFNGSSYLQTPNHADFNFGTGDFTIEGNFYLSADSVANFDGFRQACLIATKGSGASYGYGWEIVIRGDSTTTGIGLGFAATNSSGSGIIIATTTTTISKNSWHHFAVTRKNGVLYIFFNGTQVYSAYHNADIQISTLNTTIGRMLLTNYPHAFNGYLDEFNIIKGYAKYTANFTPPTAALPNDGVNGLTTFTDVTGKTWTPTNATISTTQFKFGGASGYFNGSAKINTPSHSDFAFGSGDFIIESWFFSTTTTGERTICDGRPNGTIQGAYPLLKINNSGYPTYLSNFGSSPTINITGNTLSVNNSWNHIAYCRKSGVGCLYLNGLLVATAADNVNYQQCQMTIGMGNYTGYPEYFTGYIDDFRIIKGTALYAGSFAPPTQTWK